MRILGISAYYHDSAAALLADGELIAAAQEERFTRVRHDASFPARAIASCLEQGGIRLRDVDAVVFYDKPLLKFERLLETYLATAPRGLASFATSMPTWLKDKLLMKSGLRRDLADLGGIARRELPELLFSEHHLSHAASAFFPSPFESAAVLCLDGVGEWATSSAWRGAGGTLEQLWEMRFPHSLGLLYSAFTAFCGFKVNSGEYKLMGLAPYGQPRYFKTILERLMDLKEDGTFRLDLDYFDFVTGLRMTNRRFHELFGGPPRAPEGKLTRREMDVAASIQKVTEEVVLRLARTIQRETGERRLCLAGGVALNCVANGRLMREGPFDDLWIQPAAGDAGGAVGAALAAWHLHFHQPRTVRANSDAMSGGYLGPRFSTEQVERELVKLGAVFERLREDDLLDRTAARLEEGAVAGWFSGRMEFGPRALGARSILGDPRDPEMQSRMNLKTKFRESFRPFAPAVLAERAEDLFDLPPGKTSPYMLHVASVRPELRVPYEMGRDEGQLDELARLRVRRSTIPAVTHVDFSARIQTVHRETNPQFHALLERFDRRTGCPALVNTSFNVRGEPIVCTPEDAYRCFMRTDMDALVIEGVFLEKSRQPRFEERSDWRGEFQLD